MQRALSFAIAQALPSFNEVACQASRLPGEKGSWRTSVMPARIPRRKHISGIGLLAHWPMGYLSIKYNSTHSDSTSFHSFQNSSVCFYPLYLLLGFASEKEYQLRIQGARVWSYLLVQFTARSGYHSLNSVTSLPVTLEVPQAGAKYDK